ncbi:hypothetical protein OUZ56_008732 [Daphnia magna]|uniref:Uncharacterized protein n=1 Tax=Daphnia magna TaxID=35525 RepID=A0ABR0ADV3_9CRUS|nr:hypothetical protein OUZ56_008732 [Daphnia magna]
MGCPSGQAGRLRRQPDPLTVFIFAPYFPAISCPSSKNGVNKWLFQAQPWQFPGIQHRTRTLNVLMQVTEGTEGRSLYAPLIRPIRQN